MTVVDADACIRYKCRDCIELCPAEAFRVVAGEAGACFSAEPGAGD